MKKKMKWVISGMLLCWIFLACSISHASGTNGKGIIPGDMTGDGKVNIFDVVRLLKHVTGESVKLEADPDVTGDGKDNIFDVVRLLKYVTGEDVILHSANTTVEETVLLNEKGVKITAKKLSFDGLFGPSLELLIENNTDQDLTVQCRNSAVNGFMVDTIMSADVASGKKINKELIFEEEGLSLCGIEDKMIEELEFSFHIFDQKSWDNYYDSEQIVLKTDPASDEPYSFEVTGLTVYDEGGIRIIAIGISENASFLGPGLRLYIENNCEKNITVQVRDVSVNGFMIDPVFSSEVLAGKKIIDHIIFFSSDLQKNDIQSVSDFEEVELSFHIFESESWETIVDTEKITMHSVPID